MKYWATLAVLVLFCGSGRAGYCYQPNYTYSYSGYQSYYPSYSYYPQYVAAPVSSYVAIPIPVFGSVYVGPSGATNVTTTQTRTQTATSVQTAATGTAATVATGGAATTVAVADSSREILVAVKTLTGLVGQVAQKQEAEAAKSVRRDQLLVTLQRSHDDLRSRMAAVESRVGVVPPPLMPPAPVPPSPAPPPKKDEPKEADDSDAEVSKAAMVVYKNSCFKCHQDGSATIAKNRTTKEPIALFTKAGERGLLTVNATKGIDQAQAFLTHVTEGTMPPRTLDPVTKKRLYPELTPHGQTVLILDLKNWKRKAS